MAEREERTFPIKRGTFEYYWKGRIPSLNPIYDEVADLLISGYTLTINDIKPICEKHGRSPSAAGRLMAATTSYFYAATGVKISSHRVKGRIVFFCPDIPREDTDFVLTEERIKSSSKSTPH